MFADVAKFDAWLKEKSKEVFGDARPWEHGVKLANDGDGSGTKILAWPEELGKAPTPEEVAAWAPTPPDPDKAAAPSLEIRDYKALDAALEAASTVAAVKAVFRQYLRKRAGL